MMCNERLRLMSQVVLFLCASSLSLTTAACPQPWPAPNIITGCSFVCFPLCEDAAKPDLVNAVSGCFHDAWGFGASGNGLLAQLDDVQVWLYACNNPCGCNEESYTGCLDCETVMDGARLIGREVCSGDTGCLEVLGPTDRCCPAALNAGGYQCMLVSAKQCDESPAESYGSLVPEICDTECIWEDGCNDEHADNGRCSSLTQTRNGNTGLFPGGCTPSKVCSTTPVGTPGGTTKAASPTEDSSSKRASTAQVIGTAVGATVAVCSLGLFLWKQHIKKARRLMCPTEDLLNVQVNAVTSPIQGQSRPMPPPEDTDTVAESVGMSVLASLQSRVDEGLSSVAPGTEWVQSDYLNGMGDEPAHGGEENGGNDDNSNNTERVPVETVYITADAMSQVSPRSLASTLDANASMAARSGVAEFGAICCNFRSANAEATKTLHVVAEERMINASAGHPVPGWASLFVASSGREIGGTSEFATLVLPAHDSMVAGFSYDGKERMTWRALADGISVISVVVPSINVFYAPRLRGRMGLWQGEEMLENEQYSFELSARRIANGRFQVEDKFGRISGTADAPSSGVALLAVFLCALEGGRGEAIFVRDLSWEGGRHVDGLVSIH